MSLRDFFVLAVIFGSAPVAFFSPYYGVLVWYWIAYFNPHRLAWYIGHFPVAETIAIPTLAGLVFSRNLNRRIFTRETVLLLFLWLWFAVTYLHATQVPMFQDHLAPARDKLEEVSKVLLMTFVTLLVVSSKERLRWLVLVVSASFGLLAVKIGIFGVLRGGQRIWGPTQTFIGDNNAFALALDMVIPFFYLVGLREKRRIVRWAMWIFIVFSTICVVLSYSRGGLIGFGVVLFGLWLRSRQKLIGAIAVALMATCVLLLAPPAWQARMNALFRAELDSSARERIVTWRTGINLALDNPVFGGGFQALPDVNVYQRYMPEPLPGGHMSSGPHSIYIEMLSEHGFVGLALFLSIVGCCLSSLWRLQRIALVDSESGWLRHCTHATQLSILVFLASGSFLEFANFDFWYLLVAITICMRLLCRRQSEQEAEEPTGEQLLNEPQVVY